MLDFSPVKPVVALIESPGFSKDLPGVTAVPGSASFIVMILHFF
jgi:hypothetical protein